MPSQFLAISRLLPVVLCLGGFAIHPAAQVSAPATARQPPQESVYAKGLVASLAEMTKRWGHIDDGNGGARVRTNWKEPIVEAKAGFPKDLPERIGDVLVRYLDQNELIEQFKKLQKPFAFISINPMTTERERLVIRYGMSWFSFEKGIARYPTPDASVVFFKLDSARREYVVDEVRLVGLREFAPVGVQSDLHRLKPN